MSLLKRIEDQFNFEAGRDYFRGHWHYSIYAAVVYVASIFALQRWMRDRQKYELRRPLFIWSLLLSLFSIYGFSQTGALQTRVLFTEGWEAALCNNLFRMNGSRGLWAFLFCLSKLPELGDTYFIILRKQKLIFLHWYHHITVMIYCWYHFNDMVQPCQWFISMNYFVHAIMYMYYAVRASGRYRPPVWVNIVITSLQLLQMIGGIYINLYIYLRIPTDWKCDDQVENTYFYVLIAFAMYFSYFVLFAEFFVSSYLRKPRQKAAVSARNSHKENAMHAVSNGGLPNGNIPLPKENDHFESGETHANGTTLRHR